MINAIFDFCIQKKHMNDCQMSECMVDHIASLTIGVITGRRAVF